LIRGSLNEQALAQKQAFIDIQRQSTANAERAAQLQQERLAAKAVQEAAIDFQNNLLLREQKIKESEVAISEAGGYVDQLEYAVEDLQDKAHAKERQITIILEALRLFEHILKDNRKWHLETLDDLSFYLGIQPEVADMMIDARPELLHALAEAQQQLTQLSAQQCLSLTQLVHAIGAILPEDLTMSDDQTIAPTVAFR
jgi:hypothetical protein